MGASVYYEVLRPANQQDLEGADPEAASILMEMVPGDYVAAADLEGRPGGEAAISWGCAGGLLRKAGQAGGVLRFGTVRSWLSQLGQAKVTRVAGEGGTRHAYASAVGAFNRWLTGRELEVGRAGEPTPARSFPDIEGLLAFCGETDLGARAAGRILRQYLAHCAAGGMSVSTALVHCAAIKSYFAAHEVRLDAKVERSRHRPDGDGVEARMSLADLYKMMTAGGMDAMGRAVVMVKFQAGLDASTMADRFNFEAYGQIIRHFGTEDYEAWDLDKCPVPIRLVRVKTNVRHTTFIDRDAVSCLRDYLRQKEFRDGRHERGRPLFINKRGRPVDPIWVSRMFSKAAGRAGIQARISRGALRVGSHEARDLLKSTLMVAGCAPYAADHVLGHAPRDSYEKQAVLYPEAIRREYTKASGALNLMSGVERYLVSAAAAPPRTSLGRTAPARDWEPPAGPDSRLEEILDRLGRMQADLRRAAVTSAGTARAVMLLLDRDGGHDLPEEVLRMITDPEWDAGREG